MRRANAGRVSHDAEEAGEVKVEWRLHHRCIMFLGGSWLKRCWYPSTGRSGLSTVIAALCRIARIKEDVQGKRSGRRSNPPPYKLTELTTRKFRPRGTSRFPRRSTSQLSTDELAMTLAIRS